MILKEHLLIQKCLDIDKTIAIKEGFKCFSL